MTFIVNQLSDYIYHTAQGNENQKNVPQAMIIIRV